VPTVSEEVEVSIQGLASDLPGVLITGLISTSSQTSFKIISKPHPHTVLNGDQNLTMCDKRSQISEKRHSRDSGMDAEVYIYDC